MRPNKIPDIIGLASAILCLAHCLALPLLISLPVFTGHNHWIDLAFATAGLYAVATISYKGKASKKTQQVLWFSILLILVCVAVEFTTQRHSNLLYLGAAGLIAGHILNYRNHKHTHGSE